MKIAVIAANGRTGRAFVEAALAAGHAVRAGVHHTASFADHPRLEVVQCDATNSDDVDWLVTGVDAVVSLIGHVRHSPDSVQTNAITTVIDAMQRHGARRIVSLTGTGVRMPGDSITMLDRLANAMIKIIDPKRVTDDIRHAKVLQASGLDWSLLRVLKLTNGPLTSFGLAPHGPTRPTVSRKTVAVALCELLEADTFVGQAPIITN